MIWDHAYLEFMTQNQMMWVLFVTWFIFWMVVNVLSWGGYNDEGSTLLNIFIATLVWGVILVFILAIDGAVIIYQYLGEVT